MRKIDTIIIHYTDSGDVDAKTIDFWHKSRGWSGIGYHFVIRKSGQVETGRPIEEVGAHCLNHNTGSVGIVLTGSDKEPWYPTAEQYESLKALTKQLMAECKIPISNIKRHNEFMLTNCPGVFDKEKLLKLIVNNPQPQPTPEEVQNMFSFASESKYSIDHEFDGLVANEANKEIVYANLRAKKDSPTKVNIYLIAENGDETTIVVELNDKYPKAVRLSDKINGSFSVRAKSHKDTPLVAFYMAVAQIRD